MRVRMMVPVSGGRGDGTPWPAPGGTLDVDDEEGAALCAGRLAVPVPSDRPVQTPEAPLEATTETRGCPAASAAKADWVAYAAAQGMAEDQAQAMSKADLVSRFGPRPA